MPLPEAVLRGIAEFNRGEFFEAHESLEEVWAEENGQARIFWQGVIQVAVGCCHIQRGNAEGATHLLAKGIQKLSGFPASHLGIDAEGLREAAQRCADEVLRLGPGGLGSFDRGLFPRIRTS